MSNPAVIGTKFRQGSTTCPFCQLLDRRKHLPFNRQWSQRRMSTVKGSRGLHGGTPSNRPPPESPTPASPRPTWTAQAVPDTSEINNFLKSRLSQRSQPSEATHNPFQISPEQLGKWRPVPQSNAPVQSPSLNLTDLPSVPKAEHQSFDITRLAPKKVTETETPVPPTPQSKMYSDMVKSKRSNAEIERDLFSGITAFNPNLPTSNNPFENLGKTRKPIRLLEAKEPEMPKFGPSGAALDDLEVTIQRTTPMQRAEVPKPAFSFLSARESRSVPPKPSKALPMLVPYHEANSGIKTVESSEWSSSSRERWSYDIDTRLRPKTESKNLGQEGEDLNLAEYDPGLVAADSIEVPEIKLPVQVKPKKAAKAAIRKLQEKGTKAGFKVTYAEVGLWQNDPQRVEAPPEIMFQKDLYLPTSISVSNFADLMKVPIKTLQKKMELLGLEAEQRKHNYILDSEMASLIALEFDYEPHVDNSAVPLLFPQPMPEDLSKVPLRPPIITIMGHVDHGKTTLLDTLRKSSVAANEAGGITQHIGAFSVPLSSGRTITFLDTPGHAAFLSMRERGANLTDIVVLVVAADDGVMPQTEECIAHAKKAKVPIIVTINKCDREDANPDEVKAQLLDAGLELECFGGDVQAVEISALKGDGFKDLENAITTLAEVLEVKAPQDGAVEGWIVESTVDPGRGTFATVLVKRGTLKQGDCIVAGTSFAKVRRMTTAGGKVIKLAPPGTPVEVTGWKGLPEAGDMVLQAEQESHAKIVINLRKDLKNQERDLGFVDKINEQRIAEAKALRIAREKKMVEEENKRSGQTLPSILKAEPKEEEPEEKILKVLVKADVSGSVEAVVDAIKDLGNDEVKVEVIGSSVGEIVETDVSHAALFNSKILGFNIRALNPALRPMVNEHKIEVIYHSIIYKLIDEVIERLEAMLTPIVEIIVTGSAELSQIFDYKVPGKGNRKVAGCKVYDGALSIKDQCRVTRNGRIIFDGHMDTLRRFKDKVNEVRKGNECGITFDEYDGFAVGDTIQTYKQVERKRKLIAARGVDEH